MTTNVTSGSGQVLNTSRGEARMSSNRHPATPPAPLSKPSPSGKTLPPANTQPPLLLDVHATARALGIPQKAVGNWNRGGRLPVPIRMGRRSLFWRADELAEWVRHGCPCRQRWENMKGTRR